MASPQQGYGAIMCGEMTPPHTLLCILGLNRLSLLTPPSFSQEPGGDSATSGAFLFITAYAGVRLVAVDARIVAGGSVCA